jgi:hypothetical protein
MSIFETWQHNWFGYWKLNDGVTKVPTNVPLLSQIIDVNWNPPDLAAIISYLENAPGVASTTIYPNSVCELCGAELGSPDLHRSDNSWAWPDSLAHYVSKHHVRLPDRMGPIFGPSITCIRMPVRRVQMLHLRDDTVMWTTQNFWRARRGSLVPACCRRTSSIRRHHSRRGNPDHNRTTRGDHADTHSHQRLHRHAFNADIACDTTYRCERAIRNPPVLTALKAWHPRGNQV